MPRSRRGAGRRASVAIEFALAAPLMLLLAGGIYVIGSLLESNSAVNRLAMLYATSYADCSDISNGACQTELNQYATSFALGNIAPQLVVANLTLTMAQVQMNGSTPTIEYAYPSGLSLSASQTSALQAAAVAVAVSGQTYVVVTVTYLYRPAIFGPVMTPIVGSTVTQSYTVAQLK